MICGLFGDCEFTGVPGEVSLWRWRYFVESIEDSFTEDVVAVFVRLALLGSQVFVCQFESIPPATFCDVSIVLDLHVIVAQRNSLSSVGGSAEVRKGVGYCHDWNQEM